MEEIMKDVIKKYTDIDTAYKKFTSTKKTTTGYSVKCKKGFWRVDAKSKTIAEVQARHYFVQYYMDGEYDESH